MLRHKLYKFFNFRSHYYGFIHGIENLRRWFPIIWNDCQFDQVFLFDIVQKKLELMEEFFNSDRAWSATAKEEAANIRKAIDLIIYLKEEKYEEEAFEEFHRRFTWGNEPKSDESRDIFLKGVEDCDKRYNDAMNELGLLLKSELVKWWD